MTKAKLTLMVAFILAVFLFPAAARAAIDAETVVTGKCTACHAADRIRNASKTKQEWTALIDKEIGRGAQLTRGERQAVIDWLGANYGKTELTQGGDTPTEPQDKQVAQTESADQSTNQTTSQPLPFSQQAQTGVELWQFLLSGGALVGGGALLRRRRS